MNVEVVLNSHHIAYCKQPHKLSWQAGTGLLEVLIALLVLSVGLFGIVALQTAAMRRSQDSYYQSVALAEISGMADRMRANVAGVTAGNYDSLSGTSSNPNCTTCTAVQLAQRDLYEWNTMNAALLPSGQGTVRKNGQLFRLTVYWDQERTGATGTSCSGNHQIDLTCLSLDINFS